jgi:hypothetical protein
LGPAFLEMTGAIQIMFAPGTEKHPAYILASMDNLNLPNQRLELWAFGESLRSCRSETGIQKTIDDDFD